VNDDAFTDEEGIPEVIRDFVEVCSACPVRRPCLEAAIVFESAVIDVGSVYHYVSHEPECKIKDNPDCEGCIPEESRLRRKRLLIKPQPRDIYGGIPARVRAKLSMSPCTACGGSGDVGHFMLAGIDVKPLAAEFHKERKGWPCEACKGEGRIPNPHMAEACNVWLAEQASRYGWVLDTKAIVVA
jgi:hypothetical protein